MEIFSAHLKLWTVTLAALQLAVACVLSTWLSCPHHLALKIQTKYLYKTG